MMAIDIHRLIAQVAATVSAKQQTLSFIFCPQKKTTT
jgi:hypothetical protein